MTEPAQSEYRAGMGEKIGTRCRFCKTVLYGNGHDRAVKKIRDDLAGHPEVAEAEKLKFVKQLRLRPWTEVLSD